MNTGTLPMFQILPWWNEKVQCNTVMSVTVGDRPSRVRTRDVPGEGVDTSTPGAGLANNYRPVIQSESWSSTGRSSSARLSCGSKLSSQSGTTPFSLTEADLETPRCLAASFSP